MLSSDSSPDARMTVPKAAGGRLTDNTRRHRDDRSEVAEVAGTRSVVLSLPAWPTGARTPRRYAAASPRSTAFGSERRRLAQALRVAGRDCEDCRGLAVRLVDLLVFARLGRFDDGAAVASAGYLSVPLPSDAAPRARFSRSARICFSIATAHPWWPMFLISYRITFTAHRPTLVEFGTTFALMCHGLRTSDRAHLADIAAQGRWRAGDSKGCIG